MAKAIEVLHFVDFLKTKPDVIASNATENNLLEFMQNLPVGKRTDAEINSDFQALRDEWDNASEIIPGCLPHYLFDRIAPAARSKYSIIDNASIAN